MDTKAAPAGTKQAFVEAMADNNLMPLWEVYENLVIDEPARTEPSMMWKWEEMEPLIGTATELVKGKEAEHRVLILKNPHLKGPPATTQNLVAAYQCVLPGERTAPHRHSPAAARVVLEGEGGATFVDGVRCDMFDGDLIITPNWTWHNHMIDSERRAVWVDILDLPLVGQMDAVFGQMSMPEHEAYPVMDPETARHSPQLRYPWTDMKEALDRTTPDGDGSRTIAYADPRNGGPVLPTLDCYVLSLSKGMATQKRRKMANEVCIVMSGTGESQIGEVTHFWGAKDIFTVPHWAWVSHRSRSEAACIVVISDQGVMNRLNLLREETG